MSIFAKKMMLDWTVSGRQWLEVEGRRLEAQVWGPPPDRALTLVLLHEGLGSVSLWRDFPADLAAKSGCGVLAYSRPGYGRSDVKAPPWPLDYMTREALEVLPHVLDQGGLRRAVLLGHSDGASIAAIYAGRVDDARITGLCLMAPHFFTEAKGLEAIRAAREAYRTTDLAARLGRHHDDPDATFRGWNGAWLDPSFEAWNIEDVIGGITVPVLALQGREDQYGTLAQIEALEAGLAVAPEVVLFDQCRHSPYIDRAPETVAAIARFAASQGK